MVNDTSKQVIHDRDIREPLFDYLEETYGKVRILEEKMMGRSRADVLMITKELFQRDYNTIEAALDQFRRQRTAKVKTKNGQGVFA